MLTHFQCGICHYQEIKGRDLVSLIQEDDTLLITIRRSSLDAFWSRGPGIVRGNITMLRRLGMVAKKELGLEYWFPPLVPYILKDNVRM